MEATMKWGGCVAIGVILGLSNIPLVPTVVLIVAGSILWIEFCDRNEW